MIEQICLSEEKRISRRIHNHVGISIVHSKLLAKHLLYQVKHQGLARGITYCKNFGQVILEYTTKTRSMEKSNLWIKTFKGLPKGFYWLSTYSPAVLLKLSKFARILTFSQLQKSQASKCIKAVISDSTASAEGSILLSSFIQGGIEELGLKPYNQQINAPKIYNTWEKSSMTEGDTKAPPVRSSYDVVKAVPLLSQLSYINEIFGIPLDKGPDTPKWDGFVGTINGVQEPGGKFRMFASPKAIFQTALVPIHDYIKVFRDNLITDVTLDQDRMAEWAQTKLSSGKRVISLDLSSATCRFPLEPQMVMLSQLGVPQDQLDLLRFVVKGTWKVSSELHSEFPKTLNWVVGQPLGITPSMSMFSLAHNLFLIGICSALGIGYQDTFRVLGDDVQICDYKVAELYQKVLTMCGVPFSYSKSFDSDSYAEGAGYSITSDTKVRPGKYRFPTKINHLGVLESGAHPSYGEIPQKYIDVQLLELFRKGVLQDELPIEQYSRFLYVNSHLAKENIIMDEFSMQCTLTKDEGVFHLYLREFPDWHGLSMLLRKIPSAHLLIPEVLPSDSKSWYFGFIETFGERMFQTRMFGSGRDTRHEINISYINAFKATKKSFDEGFTSMEQFIATVDKIQDLVVSSFYVTPRNQMNDFRKNSDSCKFTTKVFKLFSDYEKMKDGCTCYSRPSSLY